MRFSGGSLRASVLAPVYASAYVITNTLFTNVTGDFHIFLGLIHRFMHIRCRVATRENEQSKDGGKIGFHTFSDPLPAPEVPSGLL